MNGEGATTTDYAFPRPTPILAAQDLQDRLRGRAQARRLFRLAHAPDGVEVRNHPRRDEHRLTARELAVIHLAALDHRVLGHPGQRRLGILLHVAWHHRIAAATHGDVERRSGLARIGQAGGEADLLHEALGVGRGLDLAGSFPAPASVAVLFDVFRNRRFGSHATSVQRRGYDKNAPA